MTDLHGLAQEMAPYLREYGAAAVFVAIFLESLGLPAPGESLLVAAVLLFAQDHITLVPVALAAWAAAVAGDNVGYAIGRYGGRRLVLRYGGWVGVTEVRLARVESFFDRYGGWVVAIARFFLVARQLNGIAAGTARMAWPRFLAFNVLGAGLWVGAWTAAGALLGTHVADLLVWIGAHDAAIAAAGLVAVAVFVLIVVLGIRRRRTDPG